jgi:perosamine synthetase
MKIPLAKPIFDEEMRNAALDALQNEKFVMGESVFKFEEEFARYCGVKYAVSTNSGTSALHLSLIALGIKGGEVITTSYSFVATANVALYVGAMPVFADIEAKTCNIDPKLAKEKLSGKTRAIIPVHLFGYPADMQSILDFFRNKGCAVVEDACQAHGAEYYGRKVGTLGDVGCFSFYPSKNMTVCGDGGMVVTDDEDIARKIAKLRDCGRASHYEHDMIGFTARLNTVNAAIGRVQLRKLDKWNERRRAIARLYDHLLSDLDEVVLPPNGGRGIVPVYHLYVIRTTFRDKLKVWLEQNGIECGVHYPIPIHLQPIYRRLFGYKEGDFPNSELLSKTALSLPMFPELRKEDVEYVCEKIHEFFAKMRGGKELDRFSERCSHRRRILG